MMQSHVCYGCNDRHIGCHSTCERYIDECRRIAEEKERFMKATAGERGHKAYLYERSMKTFRRWRKK